MSQELLTAAQLGKKLHRSAFTILEWRKQGRISAEVTGRPLLFDEAKVREALRVEAQREQKEELARFGC